MPESPQQIRDAEARGAAAARVEGRLGALEEHKTSVNGQIAKLATAQQTMSGELAQLANDLKPLIDDHDRAGERTTALWQKAAWVAGFLIGLITLVLLAVQTFHGPHG